MTKYESDYLEFASKNFVWRELNSCFYEQLAHHGLRRIISSDSLCDTLVCFHKAGIEGLPTADQIMAYIKDFNPYQPEGVEIDRYIEHVRNGGEA